MDNPIYIYIVVFSNTYQNTYQEQNVIAYTDEEQAKAFCEKYNKIVSETNEFKLLKEDFLNLDKDYSEPLVGRYNCHYDVYSLHLYRGGDIKYVKKAETL